MWESEGKKGLIFVNANWKNIADNFYSWNTIIVAEWSPFYCINRKIHLKVYFRLIHLVFLGVACADHHFVVRHAVEVDSSSFFLFFVVVLVDEFSIVEKHNTLKMRECVLVKRLRERENINNFEDIIRNICIIILRE